MTDPVPEVRGVDADLDQVVDRIYVGSYYAGRNLTLLRALGITAVCDLTRYQSGPNLRELGWKGEYLHLPLADGEAVDPVRLDHFLAWMTNIMKLGDTVLIHCRAGVSRSPALTMAWLTRSGLSWAQAKALVTYGRKVANVHPTVEESIIKHLFGGQGL